MMSNTKNRQTSRALNLIGTLLFFIGLAILCYSAFLVTGGILSSNWPVTEGRINPLSARHSETISAVSVPYSFTVAGKKYRATRIAFAPLICPRLDGARRISRRFPAGSPQDVHYDPKHPENAVLIPGVPIETRIMTLAGLLLFLLALFFNRINQPRKPFPGSAGPVRDGATGHARGWSPSPRGRFTGFLVVVCFLLLMGHIFWPRFFLPPQKEKTAHLNPKHTVAAPITKPKTLPGKNTHTGPATDRAAADRKRAERNAMFKQVKVMGQKGVECVRRNDFAGAEQIYRKRLDLYRKIGGDSLPGMPAMNAGLAYALLKQEKYDQAGHFFQEALASSRRLDRPNPYNDAYIWEGLGDLEAARNRLADARKAYEKAAENWNQARGKGNANTLKVMYKQSEILKKMGNTNAETELRIKIAALKAGLSKNTPAQTASKGHGIQVPVFLSSGFIVDNAGWGAGWTGAGDALQKAPMPELIREPEYSSAARRYGILKLGTLPDNSFHYVLDGLDTGHPVLFFDRNNNRDLTDDGPPLKNQGTGLFAARINLPFDRIIPKSRFKSPFSIWFYVNEKLLEKGFANHYTKTALKGTVIIDKKPYLGRISESGTNDGDFTNDGISIDINNDGRFDDKMERIRPGSALNLNGKAYYFDIKY